MNHLILSRFAFSRIAIIGGNCACAGGELTMNTCTKCGFTCKSGCPFTTINGKLVCKKCAGTAQKEILAEIEHGQKEQNIKPVTTVPYVVINRKKKLVS